MAAQECTRAGPDKDLSQADCRSVFNALDDAILILDGATGEIIDLNRGMCEMFGYTPEEARQLRVTALGLDELGAEPGYAPHRPAQPEALNPQVLAWQAHNRAGRNFWVEARLRPVRFEGRDCLLAVIRDIDQQKQAEDALRESEARYRMVTENSLAGVYVIQDGAFVYVNPTMASIFGYRPEDIMAGEVKPPELIHPDDLPLVRDKIRRRLSGEMEAAHYTFRGLHRDGAVIYCESFGRAVEYRGRPAIVGTLLDITERQEAQAALEKSKSHYQALFEDSPISLWQQDITDLKAHLKKLRDSGVEDMRAYCEAHPEELPHCASLIKVMDVNRATLEVYEAHSKEQVVGNIASTFTPESYPAFKEAILAIAEGRTWFETEAVTTTFTGKKNHILLRLRLLPGPENAWNSVLTSILDITAIKEAAEALQTSSRVLASMAEGVVMADADGAIIFTNAAFCSMFGYKPEELLGQNVLALNDGSPEERRRVADSIMEQLTAHGYWAGELKNRRHDGTKIFTYARISGLEIAGKQCWIAVQEDITERKQVEEALRESEASYRIVTEGSLSGVYLIQDGVFRYVNPMLAKAFGYSPQEIIDRLGPQDLVHPEDRARIAANVERRLAGEDLISRSNFMGLCKDGSVIYVEALSRPVEYQGRPAVMGTLVDITERRLAEEALRASEEKYRTIFEAVNDAIVVMDPQSGEFLEVNHKYLEMLGIDAGAAMNLCLADVCSADTPYTIKDAFELMRRTVATGSLLFEWLGERRNGERFWVEISLTLTSLGGWDRILAVLRDISERKQVEDIRQRAFAELEELVAERTAGLQKANSQLRREIEERRRTEAIIRFQRDLGLALSATMGLEETLRLCVESAITIAGLDSGGVYLVDPVSGHLELAYHHGLSAEFVERVSHMESDSLNAYLVMAGRPMYWRLHELPGITDEESLREGLRSAAIIPVTHQERIIACINIASHHHEEVPATARAALETLATQVGNTIARVQADEALRRAKEDLEIKVAERTAQLQQANASLEEELQYRQRIEQSLRHSEAKYRTLVEQIPAITYILSLKNEVEILYVSPQIETLLGFTPEEWRAGNLDVWGQQIHPGDRGRVLAEFSRTIKSGEPFSAEYRLLAKSGRVIWFQDEARMVQDQEGRFLFLQGLAQDITERKRVEEALQETTHTLQTLIQASPLAIITLDLDYKVTLWNPGAERLFGWQEAEVLGRHLPVVPAEHRPEENTRLTMEMAGKKQSALELKRLCKDGSMVDAHLWTASLLDGKGHIVGNMGILADITERKRAEEELLRQAALLNLAHDAILVRDLNNRIVFWNSGAEETYGWSREEALGQNPHALLHTEFPGRLEHLEAEFLRQGQWQGELTHSRRDGRRIVVTSRWALGRDQEGRPAAILEINRDITDQKHSEAGRARLAAILEATSDLVGTADLKGRVLYLNRAGRTMLGLGEEEDISRLTIRDLQPEWADRLIAEHRNGAAERQQVWSGETSFQGRDGREIPTSQVIIAHRNSRGHVEFFSTIARDITESKRAGEALQEVNNRLRTLVQASPLAIIATNLGNQVISWNPAAERMFGWYQEEVMGRSLPSIPLEGRGAPMMGQELHLARRDDTHIDVSLSTAPLYDGAGAMIGAMGIIEDITERKRMEEKLRQVSRAFKAVTECRQAMIRATKETELLNEVCRIIAEVGGYRMAWVGFAQDDPGQSVRPVASTGFVDGYMERVQITWADRERGRGPVGRAIRTGKPAICRDTQKDPDFLPWRADALKRQYRSVLGLPLKGFTPRGALTIYAGEPNAFDQEEVKLLMGLADDLSYGIMGLRARAERRRAEQALKKSEQELRLLTARILSIQEQERRRVARELHDELGQALTVLKIHLVGLEENLAADQQPLQANCEQMLAYIDTVIENVRRLSWDLSPSSLDDLGLSASLEYLVDDVCRGHNLQSSVTMDTIDHLFAPETQINIYRIFQESLTNVIKHAGASLVSVTVKRDNGRVAFMIKDNGRGFDPRRAMSRKATHRSLGLTAMNERALMAEGSLKISSRQGQGTTIKFLIPITN